MAEVMLRYRAERQMTQGEFAKLVGMTDRGVDELEHGKNYPSPATLKAVAALVDWSVEDVGALIMSLPQEMTAYCVEPRNGEGETRPVGVSAARAKEVERSVLAEPGEGDEAGRGDVDPASQR